MSSFISSLTSSRKYFTSSLHVLRTQSSIRFSIVPSSANARCNWYEALNPFRDCMRCLKFNSTHFIIESNNTLSGSQNLFHFVSACNLYWTLIEAVLQSGRSTMVEKPARCRCFTAPARDMKRSRAI